MKLKSFLKTFSPGRLFPIFFMSVLVPMSALAITFPLAGGPNNCGNSIDNICSLKTDFGKLIDNTYLTSTVVIIILSLSAIGFAIWKSSIYPEQSSTEMTKMKKQLLSLAISLAAIIFLGAVFIAALNAFVLPKYNLLKNFISRIGDTPIFTTLHTYAADTAGCNGHLCNPLVVETTYDVLVIFFQFAMRWILIPIIIGSWVWAGFLFIQAQGNPEKINHAREKLWNTLVKTLILMFALGIAFALRNTINQIFS